MDVVCARVSKIALATVVACCAAGAVASAAGDRVVPLAERGEGADKVVVASVSDVEARWQRNQHGDQLIVSRVLLQVEETLKGGPNEAVWMDVEGGTLDGLTLRVSDMPEMANGQRGVFFLKGNGAAPFEPHLRGQGIVWLDQEDAVVGSELRLNDVRRALGARAKSK